MSHNTYLGFGFILFWFLMFLYILLNSCDPFIDMLRCCFSGIYHISWGPVYKQIQFFPTSRTDSESLQWRHNQRDSVPIIFSTACPGADQRKHQSTATGLCERIHRSPVNSPHRRLVTQKMFLFDDVIMVTDHVMFHELECRSSGVRFAAPRCS